MRVMLFVFAIFFAGDAAIAACGSRGGPAFRGPNGKCVGWAALDRVCGNPPTTNCTYEGGGIGDTSKQKGEVFLSGIVPRAAAAVGAGAAATNFNVRTVKRDGIACSSQTTVARVATCVMGKGETSCKADVDATLAKGECARLPAGTKAKIEAGSHSFNWVRFSIDGRTGSLWAERSLVLD